MSKWHGGKGSKKRPMNIDKEQFDKNLEAIFGKKKKERGKRRTTRRRKQRRETCNGSGKR